MQKINVRGISGANKCMHMVAIAYNLKKLLKYTIKKPKSRAKTAVLSKLEKWVIIKFNNYFLRPLNLDMK
ncbi:transposase [Aquimarina sp. ERC-38]|nr:transposase [Aquimarina sp. ERC-38]